MSLHLIAGSVMSMMAGLVFGGLSAYGAYNITNDSKDIKVSLCECGYVHSNVLISTESATTSSQYHVMVFSCFQWPQESSRS